MPRVTYVSHTCHIRVTVRDGGPGSSERSSFASSFITTSMSVTDLTIRIGSIRRRPHGLTISASTQAATTWKILDISTPNMHHTPPQRMLIGCHTVILCHIMSYYVILHAMRGWYWFTDPFTECCFHMYMYIYICISDINVCREAGKWSRPSAEPVGFFYTHQITVNKIKSVQNHWRNIRNRINKS